MMSKGIRIVRFADDILIFAKDKKTAGDYKAYATKVLEEELKLKVNYMKTKLTNVTEGVEFLPNQYFEDLGLINLQEYEVGLLSNYY